MLAIQRYIIHEVHKEAKKGEPSSQPETPKLELSAAIGPVDSFASKLISETHKSFGESTTLKNTHFESGHSTRFHTSLIQYLEGNTAELFYSYTVESLKDLRDRIEKEPFATGGYYLFSDYHYDGRRFLSAVLLRKKDGINFRKAKDVFIPVDGQNMNIEKIAMGFRLNHGIYISADSDKNYIALVTNQKEKLSGYFKDWVQAAGVISDDKNTSAFVKIINNIDMPMDENRQPRFNSRDEMKRACYELVEQNPNKTISLQYLSEQFYGPERKGYIAEFASQKDITIDPEFRRAPSIMKRLVTIKAKVNGIELNVDYDKLNANDVDVLEDTIIIRSPELVKQINDQRDERRSTS
jgi:nucleoid-associated protein